MEKVTKIEMFTAIKENLTDEAQIAFIDHEIELVRKKNASRSNKPTKAQAENKVLAETLYSAMAEGKGYTVTELKNEVFPAEGYSTSKVSALVQILKSEGKVSRQEVKGKAIYTKV